MSNIVAFREINADVTDSLVDFNGFDLQEAFKARYAIRFLMLFSDHYPERLGRMVLINPPSAFQLFFNAAKGFADQRTMNKVAFVYTPSKPKTEAKEIVFGDAGMDALMEQLRGIDIGNKDPAFLSWMAAVLRLEAKPGLLPPIFGWADCGKRLEDCDAATKANALDRENRLREMQLVCETPWTV
ncbi:hypothetical protein HDU93_005733 [Gonapodya sp. JEL0774]|nr:hypothetical protein HDU93_005733 [Gonapodya sp. JEL0774]